MDSYYVIDITDNLTDLINDYNQWAMLTFDFRKRGDEECIRRHNCTNTDLFNKLRSAIIAQHSELPESTVEELKESTEFLYSNDFAEKVALSNGVNSDCICVLTPGKYNSIEELDDDYMRYINLSDNLKRQSDSYSMSIWGLSVFNMYNELKAKFDSIPSIPLYADESYWKFCVENSIMKNGIIQNAKFDLDSCDPNIIGDEKDKYDDCKKSLVDRHYDSIMNDFVPYFTPDELSKYESDLLFNEALLKDNTYRKLVEGLMKDYNTNEVQYNKELKAKVESAIVSLGWNPAVPVNKKTIEYAKKKQATYFESICPNIIDITHIADTENITESTTAMRREYESHGLYPIYIVLSYNGTIFNNLVKMTQGSTYTHAGLALDSDLKKIYTFTNNKYYQGFGIDTLDIYNQTAGDKGLLSVLTIFVKKNTKNAISEALEDFAKNKDITKYNVGNLINILFNRAKTDNLQSKELVCSQFVDLILRIANINITGKANNLVLPQDFINKQHKKVYKVYEGTTKGYKDKIVEKTIKTLFKTYSDKSLKYTNLMESTFTGLDILDYVTENEKANEVIKYYRELLTPEALI